jgi:thiol-disulfide isomerase/thioredoxin
MDYERAFDDKQLFLMTGPWWVASYLAMWVAVCMLCFAVVVLLRQIGVLHARLAPMGTHFAGEGPPVGEVVLSQQYAYENYSLTMLVFSSQSCVICRELRPSFEAIRREYRDVHVEMIDLALHPHVFDSFNVRSTPYVVTIGPDAVVRGAGVANTLEQIEELLRESLANVHLSDSSAR